MPAQDLLRGRTDLKFPPCVVVGGMVVVVRPGLRASGRLKGRPKICAEDIDDHLPVLGMLLAEMLQRGQAGESHDRLFVAEVFDGSAVHVVGATVAAGVPAATGEHGDQCAHPHCQHRPFMRLRVTRVPSEVGSACKAGEDFGHRAGGEGPSWEASPGDRYAQVFHQGDVFAAVYSVYDGVGGEVGEDDVVS